MTNYQKIKDMSIDEMSEFISSIDIDECSGITTIGDKVVLPSLSDIKRWLEDEQNDI